MSTSIPSQDGPAIQCRALRKNYGDQRVLDGLDLEVHPGRVYALVGRNGAGKSTTFKTVLGLVTPDAGDVRLLGRAWQRSLLAQVGASVDGPALYAHLSATENLLVHARLTGTPRERIAYVLAAVGLASAGRKHAKAFSTGMKARLSLGIALLTDPPILMLDEPQNGLDPEGIIELRRLIKELAQRGRTVLISSHQLGEVTQLADDIGVLANGRMMYEGPLAEFASSGSLEDAYLAATSGEC